MHTSTRASEAELAARWSAGLWRGAALRTERGETYRVVFEGRRGGGAGPDFRDAVLARGDGTRIYGDIELHLRPAGWRAHGHASDPRYNGLALHVVLSRSAHDPPETPLASGRAVPLVVLGDATPPEPPGGRWSWPCAGMGDTEDTEDTGDMVRKDALAGVLRAAGIARFAEHVAHFEAELRADAPMASRAAAGWDAPNHVLWLAMAEALGYGRNRAALRRIGAALLRQEADPLMEAALVGVERLRARGLRAWYARWRRAGPWDALAQALRGDETRQSAQALLRALCVAEGGAVSPSRAAIVAVNVALPFAAAVAARANDTLLASRAQAVYLAWPGLPSNHIAREMARTLGLARLPRGAVAQQGLHYLWQHACREKQCSACPCAAISANRSQQSPTAADGEEQ